MNNGESPSLTPGDGREAVGDHDFEKLLKGGWLQTVADSAPVAVMAVDTEGLMTFWNRAAEEIFGWRAEEVLGRPNPIVPAAKEPEFRTALERTISGRPVRGAELERRRKDGSKVWIRLSNAPLLDADGRAWGVIAVAEDISEGVKAERVLREGEAKLRLLIDQTPVALAMFDREMRYLAASRGWLHDSRLQEVDVVGRCHYDLFPTLPERWKIAHQRGLKGEVSRAESDRFEWPDGTEQWLDWEVRPWHDAAGEVGGIIVFIRDVTEKVAAETALRESQRRLATLMANLPGMAHRCANDEQWTMEFVSEGCRQLTGYEPAQLVGNRELAYADLIHPDHRRAVWDDVQAALARREPFVRNYRIVTAAGDVRCVWERGRGVFDDGGELLYLEGFIMDITERKRAEEALRKLNEELEARVAERTAELRRAVDLMAGREIRMAELKKVIQALRRRLEEAGLDPAADDPLLGE